MRHPERYGPRVARDGDGLGVGQSRASGLTRAILDTFPVVKFGSPHVSNDTSVQTSVQNDKDPEAQCESPVSPIPMERGQTHASETPYSSVAEFGNAPSSGAARKTTNGLRLDPAAPPMQASSASPSTALDERDVVPAAIGRETCPICIVDFEEGDDLRVLPCEGHHRFHQQCVDPWLLELSSSCPICRHGGPLFLLRTFSFLLADDVLLADFQALETILSGESQIDLGGDRSPTDDPSHNFNRVHRFSRYLRFARRMHRERATDPTDPYMPRAADTAI